MRTGRWNFGSTLALFALVALLSFVFGYTSREKADAKMPLPDWRRACNVDVGAFDANGNIVQQVAEIIRGE